MRMLFLFVCLAFVGGLLQCAASDLVIYDGAGKSWTTNALVFPGPWDLSSHGTIAIDLENTSAQDAVRVNVVITDPQDSRSRLTMVPPGFKGTVEIDVCPRIGHPDVAARLKGLRTDPFDRDQWEKEIVPTNIPFVKIDHHWSGVSTAAHGFVPEVKVRRVIARDTSDRVWPAWFRMTAKEFFPFVDRYGQFRFRDWPRKVMSDADLKAAAVAEAKDLTGHPGSADWDVYGGWTSGPQLEATGRFRLEKRDGQWWFVDPDGHLWWSHGVVRVTPSSAVTPLDGREDYFADLPKDDGKDPFGAFYHTYDELLKPYYDKKGWKRTYDFSAANLLRKYGPSWRETFADLSHRRLRSWGLNTIANSSDRAIRLMNRTPWIERLETRGPKCKEQEGEGWWHIPDPYHPEFRRYLRNLLASRRAELTSPWCVGVFVDNEHDWRGVREETVREYFKVIREEIKRLDPKLLYFGCRFAGSTERIVRLCAEYADAVSYNVYRFRLDELKLPAGVDKPILIGEFHFGSTSDTGLFNPSLVQVKDQTARAEAYERYVTDALVHPNVVGTHWHQFSDQPVTGRFDGENFNVGFTDVCDSPYPEMRAILRKVGGDLYRTRWEVRVPSPRAARFRGGRTSAFQLAFDDTCTSQLANAVPLLEKHGIPGTFYVYPENKMFTDHEAEWAAAVRRGFVRLGNHTWDHAGRTNLADLVSSLDRCNEVIRRLDPEARAPRLVSFAVPGCKDWYLAKPYLKEALRTCGLVERPGYKGPSAKFMSKTDDALAAIEDARTHRRLGHIDFQESERVRHDYHSKLPQ